MRGLIRRFDAFLRRAYGVFEFYDHPDCLFRLRVMRLTHDLDLGDRQVKAGAKVLELHFWNEHIPTIPPQGPTLTWAVRMQRMAIASLQAVARLILDDGELADVQAVGGMTVLVGPHTDRAAEKLFRRLGFVILPYHRPLGAFGEFWENLFTWAIMWAYNAATLRHRHLLKLRRSEVWMPIEEFLRRYGQVGAQ